jgi:hypothetical protein
MTKRTVEVTILCEDLQQQVFARRFLLNRGFHDRKIRVLALPEGKGSGEQYVRKNYSVQVKAYRSLSTYRRSVCLVVLIDADTKTVDERLRQLDEALEEDSQSRRQKDEKIAVFVPKRNIDTWIYYLQGETVDEETAYPKLQKESDCEPCVKNLLNQCPSGLDQDAPPSLHIACGELQRILPIT